MKRHAAGLRNSFADRFQFAIAKHVEQVLSETHPVALPMRETLRDQMFGALPQGSPHFQTKAAFGETQRRSFDEPMIEPGRAGSRRLPGDVEIGPVREDEGRRPVSGVAEAAQLDNPAGWRGVLEGLDIPEAKMMRPPVDAVDDGVGLPGEFIVKTGGDKPPDNRRMVGGRIDNKILDGALQPSLRQDAMHGFDDVAT